MDNELKMWKPCSNCGNPPLYTPNHTLLCKTCNKELLPEIWESRPIEDALTASIAELETDNAELKERVAMLDVTAVYKSLGEMGYIGQVTNLEAENVALNARIAELEADKERLNSCESALISMVNQFFYSKAGENIFRHSFMSAEEEAAEYLVEHGIARWAGKNKSAICFNEVQE